VDGVPGAVLRVLGDVLLILLALAILVIVAWAWLAFIWIVA
jgi:hypothetical protein